MGPGLLAHALCLTSARDVRNEALLTLIGRMAKGDERALAELYDDTSAVIHGLVVKIVRDASAAEDVTIDVYMQAFRQAASYDVHRGSPLAWLFTLARSRAIDRFRTDGLRRAREAPMDTMDEIAATTTDPVESTLVDESRRAVRAALDALPTEQRRTLELAYYTGMSHREIADALNLPLGTVKTRIRRAMIVMRGTLHPWLSETTA